MQVATRLNIPDRARNGFERFKGLDEEQPVWIRTLTQEAVLSPSPITITDDEINDQDPNPKLGFVVQQLAAAAQAPALKIPANVRYT